MATFRWPVGWDPSLGLRLMQRELERLTGSSWFSDARGIGGGNYPPINVYNGPEDIVVECELAGVKKDDLDISITGETLQIKGVKRPAADDEQVRYQKRERGEGDFNRTIVLPDRIESGRVEAKLADGILTIRVPKSEAAKARQIAVD